MQVTVDDINGNVSAMSWAFLGAGSVLAVVAIYFTTKSEPLAVLLPALLGGALIFVGYRVQRVLKTGEPWSPASELKVVTDSFRPLPERFAEHEFTARTKIPADEMLASITDLLQSSGKFSGGFVNEKIVLEQVGADGATTVMLFDIRGMVSIGEFTVSHRPAGDGTYEVSIGVGDYATNQKVLFYWIPLFRKQSPALDPFRRFANELRVILDLPDARPVLNQVQRQAQQLSAAAQAPAVPWDEPHEPAPAQPAEPSPLVQAWPAEPGPVAPEWPVEPSPVVQAQPMPPAPLPADTDPAQLYHLAAEHPEFWPAVAAHSNAYPELLEWLGSMGDPATDQVLIARFQAPLPPA